MCEIDINDENNIVLHQCKCYEGTEYNHSEIKEALEWMLKHFADNKDSDYKYYLYGVYKSEQHKLPQIINVEFAKKNFFTKKVIFLYVSTQKKRKAKPKKSEKSGSRPA